MRDGRLTGTIRSLKDKYGFIQTQDAQGQTRDYFFLPSALEKVNNVAFTDLQLGMRVEFTPITHDKGPRAIEIRVRPAR